MADGFEAQIGSIVGAVSDAAVAMQNTAKAMSVNAEGTQQRTSAVAAGAEESNVNVQTVAAASEDLAASSVEIGRQVSQASVAARKSRKTAVFSKVVLTFGPLRSLQNFSLSEWRLRAPWLQSNPFCSSSEIRKAMG
jgi:methyl-accepting chemotaxis protein